mmetsp:Transcript_2034/g.5182  ORF Transcript_2034/g.5182 Transcript_2034/m.5182 type:complete len:212 (-) Transcript_2034:443-1078(-)
MVQERAAPRVYVDGPACRVLDAAGLVLLRRHSPHLLQAEPVDLLALALAQCELVHRLLRQGAVAALRKQRRARAQLHATLERWLGRAVLGHAHVVGRRAHDVACVIEQELDRTIPRVHLHSELLRLRAWGAVTGSVGQAGDVGCALEAASCNLQCTHPRRGCAIARPMQGQGTRTPAPRAMPPRSRDGRRSCRGCPSGCAAAPVLGCASWK